MYKELLGRLFLVVCFSPVGSLWHVTIWMFIVNPKFLYLKPQGPSLFYHLRQSTLLILSY